MKRIQSLKKDLNYFYSPHQKFYYTNNQSFPPKITIQDTFSLNQRKFLHPEQTISTAKASWP